MDWRGVPSSRMRTARTVCLRRRLSSLGSSCRTSGPRRLHAVLLLPPQVSQVRQAAATAAIRTLPGRPLMAG
eukprot:scaffold365571_cov32-Prasinocladus_malaysianus.AAC.1